MVDDAQAARPHRVDGREVEPKRAVPRDVSLVLLYITSALLKFTLQYTVV